MDDPDHLTAAEASRPARSSSASSAGAHETVPQRVDFYDIDPDFGDDGLSGGDMGRWLESYPDATKFTWWGKLRRRDIAALAGSRLTALGVGFSWEEDDEDALFAALAGIRELRFYGYDARLHSPDSLRHLSALHTLRGRCPGLGVAELAALPSPLAVLDVSNENESVAGTTPLDLPSLTTLKACGTAIVDAALAPLSALQVLDVSGCDDFTGTAFAHLRSLRRVVAAYCCALSDAGLTALAGAPVEHLVISGCPAVTDVGLSSLAASPLAHLDVAGCAGVSDVGLAPLTMLLSLDISKCPAVTGAAFVHLPALRTLTAVKSPALTDAGLAGLAAAPIETLDVTKCPLVTDAGFAGLTSLRTLIVRDCPGVTGAGVVGLRALCRLDAADCLGVTDAALSVLPPGVEEIDVSSTAVGQAPDAFARLGACRQLALVLCQLSDAGIASLCATGIAQVAGCWGVVERAEDAAESFRRQARARLDGSTIKIRFHICSLESGRRVDVPRDTMMSEIHALVWYLYAQRICLVVRGPPRRIPLRARGWRQIRSLEDHRTDHSTVEENGLKSGDELVAG
jgi:hypothetical protein